MVFTVVTAWVYWMWWYRGGWLTMAGSLVGLSSKCAWRDIDQALKDKAAAGWGSYLVVKLVPPLTAPSNAPSQHPRMCRCVA